MTLVDLNVSRERVRRSRQPGGEGDVSVETSLSTSRRSPTRNLQALDTLASAKNRQGAAVVAA